MTILITIGPTQEPLDAMRLISNRSTGELGTLLALRLVAAGHRVIALRGTGSTADPAALLAGCERVIPFTTTADLRSCLENLDLPRGQSVDAVFHAAAVSDFYLPGAGTGKIPSKGGSLTLTLEPTQKLLPLMREWFPNAVITGWKFEAGAPDLENKGSALEAAAAQISECRTDACVVNGPSYGEGFGVLGKKGTLTHLPDRSTLCDFLCDSLAHGAG